MGLICWLPLMGTLENKGVSNVTITGTNITSNTSGKIGSCYSFNGSSSYIKLDQSFVTNSTTEFSYACWVKFNSTASACLFSARTATNSNGITLFVNNSGNILYDIGKERRTKAYNFSTGTWYHIAFTYKKGSYKKIYVNGAEIDSVTSTGTMTEVGSVAFIGASQDANTTVSANYLNGYLNDVRIWNDHCLSAAEVREISQGLVLHYKLDQPANINNNLYVGSEKFTGSWGNASNWTTSTETYQNFVVKQRSGTWGGLHQNIPCTNGDIFTISFYAKVDSGGQIMSIHRSSLGNVTTGLSILGGNFSSGTNWIITTQDGTQWNRYWATVQIASADITYLQWRIENNQSGKNLYICGIKLEKGTVATPWSPAASEAGETNIIQDSSGYNHNGTVTGNITLNSNTPRYSVSSLFNGTERITTTTPGADIRTLSCWCKTTKNSNTSQIFVADSFSGMCISFYKNNVIGVFGTTRSTGSKSVLGTAYKENDWNHIAVVKTGDAGTRDIYCNGIKLTPTTDDYWSAATGFFVGARNASNTNPYYGYLSDVRAYVTPLDADAIRQLYEVGAKVDNKGNLHTFELIEEQNNIFSKIEFNRTLLQWGDGLGRYQQANNTTTLTEDGLRIYRPPNLTQANDGKTMWGGMKLINQSTDSIHSYNSAIDNIWGLQKNHTYLWAFHVKGQSSQASESITINHNMGNGVSNGVGPIPTILGGDRTVPANFQGEKDCYLIFTIADDLVKICTKTGSGFTAEQSYLSYRHLQFYWGYGNTGELGTDIYVTNIRLYDITNHMAEFTKMGQAKFFDFIEQMNKCQVRKNSELLATEFIEL